MQDFIRKRLAPDAAPNYGKQTPMRGHPVFIAQHACAVSYENACMPRKTAIETASATSGIMPSI